MADATKLRDHARVADVARNLVQVRDGRTYDDLGVHELPSPNAEMGDLIEIKGTTWEVVDIVPAKADSAVVPSSPGSRSSPLAIRREHRRAGGST